MCVRYRFDTQNKHKIKTVELIVETENANESDKRIPDNKIMEIRVGYHETHIQRMLRSVGGKWNKVKQVWEVPYKHIKTLGLINRITVH